MTTWWRGTLKLSSLFLDHDCVRLMPKNQNIGSEPLFPRYIFAWFNAYKQLHEIRYTRGVHKVVSFGGDPSPVDDDVIALIKSRVSESGLIEMSAQFKFGDKVTIHHETLGTLEGIFKEGIGDTERVRILLSTVNYQAHIEVNKELVALATGCVNN